MPGENCSMYSETTSFKSFHTLHTPNYSTPSYDSTGKEMFKRHPIILAEKPNMALALYQQSSLISDSTNYMINKFNSRMEIILTIFIFVSSILVLSIEKYWWGGYLTWNIEPSEDNSGYFNKLYANLHHMKHHIKHHEWYLYYEHELYTINNMIRLTVVASSIAFFMILSLLDVTQVYVTGIYACYHQIN